jgi:hypothetical protein
MGLNGFILFLGFGLGSLIFGGALQQWGFAVALAVFGVVQSGLAVMSLRVFHAERPPRAPAPAAHG